MTYLNTAGNSERWGRSGVAVQDTESLQVAAVDLNKSKLETKHTFDWKSRL